ncbi:MAG: O-antigen polymerase [Tepidibacillus sp.]
MVYILLFMLFIMIFISFFISKFDILSPWLISSSMYAISVISVILNKKNWDITLSSYTVFIIIIALLSFGIGEIFAKLIFKNQVNRFLSVPRKKIKFHSIFNLSIYICSIVILIWYYYRIQNIALQVGYQNGRNLLIQYARLGILQYGISIGPLLAISTFVLRSISYIYTFVYLYNKLLCKKENWIKDLHMLIPTVIYLAQYSLSGSRGAIIEYISYFLVLVAIFMTKSKKRKIENNRKIIKYAIIGLSSFLLLFIILGNLKGWKGSDVTSLISTYAGGSILALDNYLLSNNIVNDFFGQESLLGINNLFHRIGIYSSESSRILEFTTIGPNITTNIYTAIRRYIQDFGVMGMLIIQFFLGMFFNMLYLIIKRSKEINYLYIFYSLLFMALVYQSIDEQFLVSFLSVTQIFTIGFSFILYRLLLHKKIQTANFNKDQENNS